MSGTVLLVIDMQQEMGRRIGSGRDAAPADVEARVADLIARARSAGVPVVHVHHDDPDPGAAIRLDRPGGMPMSCARPAPGEAVIVKKGSSGFAGTTLERDLRALGANRIVVVGAVLGFCVSSTVRDAVARGFRVDLASDAVLSFDLPDGQGGTIPAATVRAVHGTTLALDFARWLPSVALDLT
jgi:nicotinamidase-related amidase